MRRNLREKLYCEKCDKLVDYDVIEKKEVFNVKGENIEITSQVAVCRECGNELSEPTLEDENLKKAFRKYAEKYNLILPEEIKRIRLKYGIASQEIFAKILGIGKATLARYEAGALPSESISNLIKQADDPDFFEKLLDERADRISVTDYRRIKDRLSKMKKRDFGLGLENLLQELNKGSLDLSKLYGVVTFVLKIAKEKGFSYLSKVRFVKFLWFIDKAYYDKNGKALTGLTYAHLPMGPAPNHHEILLELLKQVGVVDITIQVNDDDSETIKIQLKDSTFDRYLSDEEKKFIKSVISEYIDMSTKDLIELTHKDDKWLSTKDGELIIL